MFHISLLLTSSPFYSSLFYTDLTCTVFDRSECFLNLQVYLFIYLFLGRRHHKHRHSLRVAHTAELGFALHDRKLGFHNPLSSETFHRLLSAHLSFSQSMHSPSVSPARSMPVPWAAPALSAGSELLHGCPARVYFKTTSMFLHGYRG